MEPSENPTRDEKEARALTINEIQTTVATEYGFTERDMTRRRRPSEMAYTRQVAMYLSRELTDHSFPKIGAAFERHHATVMYAHSAVTDRIRIDKVERERIAGIIKTLREKD